MNARRLTGAVLGGLLLALAPTAHAERRADRADQVALAHAKELRQLIQRMPYSKRAGDAPTGEVQQFGSTRAAYDPRSRMFTVLFADGMWGVESPMADSGVLIFSARDGGPGTLEDVWATLGSNERGLPVYQQRPGMTTRVYKTVSWGGSPRFRRISTVTKLRDGSTIEIGGDGSTARKGPDGEPAYVVETDGTPRPLRLDRKSGQFVRGAWNKSWRPKGEATASKRGRARAARSAPRAVR